MKPAEIAIEYYLFSCVDNAIKREWRKEQRHKHETIDAIDIEAVPMSPKGLESAMEEIVSELVFKDPVDRIIAQKYGSSDSEIAKAVKENLGKSMTKQAIRKRRVKHIEPLMSRSLEIRGVMKEDMDRVGKKSPIMKASEDLEDIEE